MLQTVCFTIENVVLDISKSHEKTLQNRCKIYARKRHAKSMENDAKMHQKWEPKSIQNLKNAGNNGIRKLMPKFYAKKTYFFRAHRIFIDFGLISVAYGNVPAPGLGKLCAFQR